MGLNRSRVEVSSLHSEQRGEMFALMSEYYENVTREDFERDLNEKNWVLILREKQAGKLAGFSTQRLISFDFMGETVLVLFSGDTIVSREHWGSMALGLSFGELMFDLLDQYPDKPLYWMLISKGLRTYKYLSACFHHYYPSYNETTPDYFIKLRDALGTYKYPERYDATRGVILADDSSQYLKTEYQPDANPSKPQEVFFYSANPGYIKGDELVCLARLSSDNIDPAILRFLNLIK